ncbi:hypothetical protein [Actinocorallia libanotica]
MTELLQLMRGSGDVTGLADRAEALLWDLPDPQEAAQSAASLAVLLAPFDTARTRALVEYAEGLLDHAERLLPSARDPERPAWVLAELAKALAFLGSPEQARIRIDLAAARVRGFPEDRALLLSELVEAAAAIGDRTRADDLLTEARDLLAAATDLYQRFLTTLELAETARIIGDERQAGALLAEAERLLPAIRDPAQRSLARSVLPGKGTGMSAEK